MAVFQAGVPGRTTATTQTGRHEDLQESSKTQQVILRGLEHRAGVNGERHQPRAL